ncbi:hypothetical protein KFU94_65320 [Chloroflexi bacterium TSY]|nr:hypothetical protein [Chloroflexi bacterium TSY]
MSVFTIFMTQITISLIACTLLAVAVWPHLREWSLRDALIPLLFIQAFRVVALGVLVPNLVGTDFPQETGAIIAYGDLASAILALLALFAATFNMSIMKPLTWLFNIVGFIDLFNAMIQGSIAEMYQYKLGPQWYVPTFYTSFLLLTHILIFMLLLRKREAEQG